MKTKGQIGFQSALLVSTGVIVAAFVAAILAWWVGAAGVGVLLMAVAVTGLLSRLWGLYALKNMTVTVQPERETLSAGQSVTIHYTLNNKKVLPLVWLELCQDVPVRRCLEPDEGFTLWEFSPEEAEHTGRTQAYIRPFAFVMGYSTLAWDTQWTGVCRGVYRPQNLVLRSGDGFGLTQSTGEVEGLSGRVLVVWPKLVAVETWPFLRHVWSGTTGKAGWSEDPTVMRGERAYQPGDAWKRIDWRTAARTDELMVRQFDTVTPLSVLFILDAAALADKEEAISVTASLIHALSKTGIDCGLALPATEASAPVVIPPANGELSARQCLFALAEVEAETATETFDEVSILSAAAETGQVWIVSQGTKSLGCPVLAGKLSESGVRLLAAQREDGVTMTKVYTFDEIYRRKEARS
jgi:uncharacterized protein (DUF58 family)